MVADAVGDGGKFTFVRANVPAFQREGNEWKVPDAEFDTFKNLALARLSTVLDVAGQSANAYIHFDGSNDYVEFTGGATGLLDWTANWTVGISLVEFEVKADGKFITLFSSGGNAIMLRRGGIKPWPVPDRQRRSHQGRNQYVVRPKPRRQAAVHLTTPPMAS